MSSEPPVVTPTCNTLWIGGDLGPIAAACLTSFLRRGHRVVVYCYDPPRDAPPGVELADAAVIIPTSRIIRHAKTGSYALFSDLFRYTLLRLGHGLWIDCDVYCLRRFAFDGEYVFGWQQPNSINGAVLRLPSDSPVLEKLIAIFDMKSPVLPWLRAEDQSTLMARRLAGEAFGIGDLRWGAAGPAALTYLLTEAGLARHAYPRTVFYPVPHHHGGLLLRADADVSAVISPRTLAVHLWNEALKPHIAKAQRGSPVDRLLSQGTLVDETFLDGG